MGYKLKLKIRRMKVAIQVGLIIIAGVLTYFIVVGIQSKIEFRNKAEKLFKNDYRIL